jgi:hypothetical protein
MIDMYTFCDADQELWETKKCGLAIVRKSQSKWSKKKKIRDIMEEGEGERSQALNPFSSQSFLAPNLAPFPEKPGQNRQ